jgi:hypothetical protein
MEHYSKRPEKNGNLFYMDPKTEEFIQKARFVHGNRYDYNNSVYFGYYHKIAIRCLQHGEFIQTRSNHLNGRGCPACGKAISMGKLDLVQSRGGTEFERRVRAIHGVKYGYSLVRYVDPDTFVIIVCPIHGEFQQAPRGHLERHGCKQCGISKSAESLIQARAANFVERARKLHGDLYNYDGFTYHRANTKSVITCGAHGQFLQSPDLHLQGHGCPVCGVIASTTHSNGRNWRNYAFRCGTVAKVQGYEPVALADLERQGYQRSDLKLNSYLSTYRHGDVDRKYYPDILVSKEKRVIEVKSTYTMAKAVEVNLAKAESVLALGYAFEFWIYDNRRRLVKNSARKEGNKEILRIT